MPLFQRIFRHLRLWWRQVWNKRQIILRGLAVWLAAFLVDMNFPGNNIDLRLKLRGSQLTHSDIVLVLISQNEWIYLQGDKPNWLIPLKELTYYTDSFFWNEDIWEKLLNIVLKEEPSVVGVSFFFGKNILSTDPLQVYEFPDTFRDPRVIWAAHRDSEGRVRTPVFSDTYGDNIGLNSLNLSSDGIIRSFSIPLLNPNHISEKLTSVHTNQPITKNVGSHFINYQGKAETFPILSLTQLFNSEYPKSFLKDKVVLIGSLDSEGHLYRTPLGKMSRAEIMANITSTMIKKQWVEPLHSLWTGLILMLGLLVAMWFLFLYPHGLALVCLIWITGAWTIASIYLFDTFQIWTPILSMAILVSLAYVVFVAFRLTEKESANLKLEQERKFLLEVEELKNNFVSLISHDLKTPIAKIQAICDRLLTVHQNNELTVDLYSLRKEGSELHRYIQTILQITKVESRNFKVRKDSVDINDLVEQVVEQLIELAREKNIAIKTELEPMFLVEADSTLIQEVIHNLIGNAIKYTPIDGKISVRTQDLGAEVVFSVSDTGMGISEEEQSQIFDKFFRGKNAKMHPKGSGLGLYLVKYFVELHHGKVFVESKEGIGTKFGFSLPLEEEASIND